MHLILATQEAETRSVSIQTLLERRAYLENMHHKKQMVEWLKW
jgi:hypothetical protein